LKGEDDFSVGLLVGDRWDQYKIYLKNKEYDALTGLPNLNYFKAFAKELLLDHPEYQYVIVYSDLSRIKFINDTLGYDIGDKILCDLAKLFKGHLQEYECLARISEDNFLVLMRYDSIKELRKRILTVNEQFNSIEKIKYPGNKFIIISGAAKINDVKDINTVIENANIARKSVKDSLKAACKIFDESMKKDLQKEAEITNDMEQALKNGEKFTYHPTDFRITLNHGALGVSKKQGIILFEALREQFRIDFEEKYIKNNTISEIIVDKLGTFDYADIYDIINELNEYIDENY